MLGELVESLVVLDRAVALEEGGLSVSVFRAFATACSDRNLAVTAQQAGWLGPKLCPSSAKEAEESESQI